MTKRDNIYVQVKRSERENQAKVLTPEATGCERILVVTLIITAVIIGIAFLFATDNDTVPLMTPAGMLLGGLIC